MIRVMVIHRKHFKDRYPLCWPMGKSGAFRGTFKDKEVDCPTCLTIMEEISRGIVRTSAKSS